MRQGTAMKCRIDEECVVFCIVYLDAAAVYFLIASLLLCICKEDAYLPQVSLRVYAGLLFSLEDCCQSC